MTWKHTSNIYINQTFNFFSNLIVIERQIKITLSYKNNNNNTNVWLSIALNK